MPGKSVHSVTRIEAPPVITVDQATEIYHGQWVIMRVADVSEYGLPLSGQVITHSSDRRVIDRALKRIVKSPKPPGDLYYLFAATRLANSWQEFRDALERAAAEGKVRDSKPW
jgi:hypothetical protein